MKVMKTISLVMIIIMLTVSIFASPRSVCTPPPNDLNDFYLRLSTEMRTHLDYLIDNNLLGNLKGKSVDGMLALAYYLTYERTGVTRYRTAAIQLADQILREMRSTPNGVISIKVVNGVEYGGPPSFGQYTAYAAYVLHKEVGKPGRDADIQYIANSVDNYYWYGNLYPGQDWWAADVQVNNGLPDPSENPLKPTPINKNAYMAMTAAMLSSYVASINPTLAARLKSKADACIYNELIPAQESDGFWHYNLNGNDPKEQDVLGYFMLSTSSLIQAQKFTNYYNDSTFHSAMNKAYKFALSDIAPITAPNSGPPSDRATLATPNFYLPGDEIKRGFQLGVPLFAGQYYDVGVPILDFWMQSYPKTNTGEDGGHASFNSALILYLGQVGTTSTSPISRDTIPSFIFPNPASDYIQLNTTEKCDIHIYNLTGQLLLSQTISPNNNIDVSFLPNGVYCITLRDSKALKTEKLIIAR